MDGLGSPDMMDHSMLDLKNSSPYTCYSSSPKLTYDAFPHNRGNFLDEIEVIIILNSHISGLNLGLMKSESLWHQAASYGAGYGGSPVNYGLPTSPNISTTNAI